jgi:hypothetical protein
MGGWAHHNELEGKCLLVDRHRDRLFNEWTANTTHMMSLIIGSNYNLDNKVVGRIKLSLASSLRAAQ